LSSLSWYTTASLIRDHDMIRYLFNALALFSILSFSSLHTEQTWKECIVEDMQDTLSTGMPIAVGAAVIWYIANRIPHDWQDLDGPVAEFIYETWEEQHFLKARKIILKRIPADSVLAKIVVYTQELPGALAVGEPLIVRVKSLLKQKEELFNTLRKYPEKKVELKQNLIEVEEGLDECRFVCGHERVHKENHHTYQLLGIQFLAPFFVYSWFKHLRMLIERKCSVPAVEWILRRSLARSVAELLIGWARTQQIERKADLYASDDPRILRAGLRLFKRALKNKAIKRSPVERHKQATENVIGWILKYTHPTLAQRIAYLTKYVEKLERKRMSVHPSLL
jgi:Zn-dependent protease with chaperone function